MHIFALRYVKLNLPPCCNEEGTFQFYMINSLMILLYKSWMVTYDCVAHDANAILSLQL